MSNEVCSTCRHSGELVPVFCVDGSDVLRRQLLCLECLAGIRRVGYGELVKVMQ